MKHNELIRALEALVSLIDAWNDAVDDDRGRSNKALCLLLWDDGSGRLGTSTGSTGGCGLGFNEQHGFDTIGQLADYLSGWLSLSEEAEATVCDVCVQVHGRDTNTPIACPFCLKIIGCFWHNRNTEHQRACAQKSRVAL